jgi:hypothetical protein
MAAKRWDDLVALGPAAVPTLIERLGTESDRWLRQAVAATLGRMGDARACETVLRWLFAPSLRIENEQQLAQWNTTFAPLFGDLTTLVLSAAAWVGCTEAQPSPSTTEYQYDLTRAEAATHAIAERPGPEATNLLHLIAGKQDIQVPDVEVEDYGGNDRGLSFAEQRRIAQVELGRRGGPGYDTEAWVVLGAGITRR